MDSLIEISYDDWPKLQALYRKDWPQGVAGYCLLDMQIRYPSMYEDFNFKVYCPGGDINNGMVAISDKEHYYQLFVHPISKDTSAIENALLRTKIVDWKRNVCAPAVSCETLACLKRVSERLSLRIYGTKACKHFLDRDSKPLEITKTPENAYVGPLKTDYLDLVDRTWTYYTPGHSRLHFETLAKNGLVFVLYSSIDHKPMCWMSVDQTGAFAHMYCLAIHRRNGYAEYLTKIVTNQMLKQKRDLLAYTLPENSKPQNLFDKLGFDSINVVSWAVFFSKET